jgi:hypothetical protein
VRKLLWGVPVSLLVIAGLFTGLVAWNLHTFNRLTEESLIARLRFVPVAPQQYDVVLRTGDFCNPQTYRLYGDEWRIDARFLKWKPWANLLGMDAMYRLERLSGRYKNIDDENRQKHFAYAIGEEPVVDLVRYAERDWGGWMPVDTSFGSSVYETINPAYEYAVYRSQSGLFVRKNLAAPARYENGSLVIQIEKDCAQGE